MPSLAGPDRSEPNRTAGAGTAAVAGAAPARERRLVLRERRLVLRERGFVLLLVLWSMALLGAHVTATGRSELALAANLQAAATAEALADGALHEAIWHLLADPPQR
jgi:hypothetical protein